MFFTRKDDETPFGANIMDGLRSWRSVQWQMGSHLFWVTVVVQLDDERLTDTLMLLHPEDIATLVANGADSSEVTHVQLVSAPYMNETGQWAMEPLTHIIKGFLPGEDKTVHLLKCRNGTIYLDEDVLADMPTLIKSEIVFSEPT